MCGKLEATLELTISVCLGNRPALFSAVGAAAAVAVVLAAVGIVGRGLPQRLPSQALRYASGSSDRDHELSDCATPAQGIRTGALCRLGSDKTDPPDFVVWGDSHAEAVAPAFKALANETGSAGWLATHPGCAPLLGVVRLSRDASGCDKFNDSVISAIERSHIRTVFLVARWEVNALGRTSWETSEGLGAVSLQDAYSKQISPAETRAVFERGLTRTLARLNRDLCSVVLVLDVPNTAMNTPVFLARSAMRGSMEASPEVRIDVAADGSRIDLLDDLLVRLSSQWHALTIDPKVFLCRHAECLVAKDGRSIYRDDHHLTVFGALQLVGLIRPTFEEAISASHQIAEAQGRQQRSSARARRPQPEAPSS